MAEKMTHMKNAMMQHDMGVGMARTYGCVKLTTLKNTPVTVSIVHITHYFRYNLLTKWKISSW
jgi:hypothetical protein